MADSQSSSTESSDNLYDQLRGLFRLLKDRDSEIDGRIKVLLSKNSPGAGKLCGLKPEEDADFLPSTPKELENYIRQILGVNELSAIHAQGVAHASGATAAAETDTGIWAAFVAMCVCAMFLPSIPLSLIAEGLSLVYLEFVRAAMLAISPLCVTMLGLAPQHFGGTHVFLSPSGSSCDAWWLDEGYYPAMLIVGVGTWFLLRDIHFRFVICAPLSAAYWYASLWLIPRLPVVGTLSIVLAIWCRSSWLLFMDKPPENLYDQLAIIYVSLTKDSTDISTKKILKKKFFKAKAVLQQTPVEKHTALLPSDLDELSVYLDDYTQASGATAATGTDTDVHNLPRPCTWLVYYVHSVNKVNPPAKSRGECDIYREIKSPDHVNHIPSPRQAFEIFCKTLMVPGQNESEEHYKFFVELLDNSWVKLQNGLLPNSSKVVAEDSVNPVIRFQVVRLNEPSPATTPVNGSPRSSPEINPDPSEQAIEAEHNLVQSTKNLDIGSDRPKSNKKLSLEEVLPLGALEGSIGASLPPLTYRADIEDLLSIPLVGRDSEIFDIAVECVKNLKWYADGKTADVGRGIIPVCPQMFGSGKTRLGIQFADAIKDAGLEDQLREKFISSSMSDETKSDHRALIKAVVDCISVSIDLEKNKFEVGAVEAMERDFAKLLASGICQSLNDNETQTFVRELNKFVDGRYVLHTIKGVFKAYAKIGDKKVFVHVDEIGHVEASGTRSDALSSLRRFRTVLNCIIDEGHLVFVTGNTPTLFVLGKSKTFVSPADTKVILLNPLNSDHVETLLTHFKCPAEDIAEVANQLIIATSGVPRLVMNGIKNMAMKQCWVTETLTLEHFNIEDGYTEWDPPKTSEELRRLLKLSIYDIEVDIENDLGPNVTRKLLFGDSPPDDQNDVQALEACRAYNLFLRRRENTWHLVWPRVLILKWMRVWERRNTPESISMTLICRDILEPGMVDKGRMLETILKIAVRRRITCAAAIPNATLEHAFPFVSKTPFAEFELCKEDGQGRHEYMPKIVQSEKAALPLSKSQKRSRVFVKWSQQLQEAFKGKSTTYGPLTLKHEMWTCNVADFPILREAMPKNIMYEPGDQSSSEDILYRFSELDFKIQAKNVRSLTKSEIISEVEKISAQNLAMSTLLLIAAVMPADSYNLPADGSSVSISDSVLGTFEAGKLYQDSIFGKPLGKYLSVLYLNEAGMKHLIHEFEFNIIRSKSLNLRVVLSPVKLGHR